MTISDPIPDMLARAANRRGEGLAVVWQPWSRIGRLPIRVPDGVDVTIDGRLVTVTGPKGTLSRELHPEMLVSRENGTVIVARPTEQKTHKQLHGLTRTLVNNMVVGVTTGYRKGLEIQGVGYRAALTGRKLTMNLVYSHQVEIDPPDGISFELENPTHLAVVGIDKELVGQIAAKVRSSRKTEPYNVKHVRYAGEQVRRKAGKAGKIGGKK